MNTRTQVKHLPFISTPMAGIAFFIHIIISVINFNFIALINNIPLHQSNISTLLFMIIQPLLVAILIAPILSLVRHTDFIDGFRNILFTTITLYLLYTLADMSGMFR